jgi:hypothetical protein
MGRLAIALSFLSGDSCVDLGYTERCLDGSYRLPGHC